MFQEETQQEKSIQGKIRIKTFLYGIKEFKEKIRLFRKKVLWSAVKYHKMYFKKKLLLQIRKPLKEKTIYQNTELGMEQKKEEVYKHRTEDGKVIKDNSKILSISDLNLTEDDKIKTEDVISEDKHEGTAQLNNQVMLKKMY